MNSLEEKRKYLRNYGLISYELDINKKKENEIINDITGIKSMVYSDMPKSNKKTDLSDRMIELEKGMNKLRCEKARLLREKWKIINSIDNLRNSREKAALRDMYINALTIHEIAKKRSYSIAQVNRDLKNAVINYEIPKDDIE